MSRANLIAALDAIRATRPSLSMHYAKREDERILQAIDKVRMGDAQAAHAVTVGKYAFPEDEVREPARTRWRDTMASGIGWALGATEREIEDVWRDRGCV